MKTLSKSKILAMILIVVMLVASLPLNSFAGLVNYNEADGDYYKVVSQKNWELAPGINEAEIVLNNDSGDRNQVMHVVEVDVDNPYTKVIPSSKGMVPTAGAYGVQTMDQQAAYAEANGYGNVIAAMNISLSWYDSDYYDDHPELVGEPLGYLILDGVQYTNSQGKTAGAQTCLVINYDEKDGVARPADLPKTQIRSTSDAITGWEEQVIPANFGFLVKDGKMVYTTEEHTSEGASRSMLGIKEDGTIVMVMNDGRQAPYSTGFNNYEMSEAMLKLGCVYAINGDGGGSSQFLSQRPGKELEINCSPSDGALRATTHGVLAISTAPSTGEFVKAHVEAEHQYYTPNSSVQFTAIGTDLVGSSAEIPAEATWQLSDETFGTIDENGLFVSNGKTGEVSAQLVYEGEVKGSAAINVVVPTSIAFGTAEAYTVPFGESINLNVTAKYDVFDVALKASDYTITAENTALGTINGTKYTAGETAGTTNITVTLSADTSILKIIPLTVGKGSEVIFDFEEGSIGADLNNWVIKDHEGKYAPYTDLEIVSAENGMVHNGNTALAVHMPTHQHIDGSESYNANSITWVGDPILLENATSIGLWVYIPEEATQTEIALNYVWYNDSGVQQRTTPDLCLNDVFNGKEYSGWHYLSVPISKSIAYIEDATEVAKKQGYKRNFFLKFYVTNSGNAGDESSYMGDITYYIDNVTVDYSSAVDDRILPTFGTTYVKDINADIDSAITAGNTVTIDSSTTNFTAEVSDNIAIDSASAKVLVDGKAVTATFKNGKITSSDVTLGNGVHRVEFAISDTAGNETKTVRYISVAGDNVAVNVVPRNADATVAYTGSTYWVDIVANDIEKIDTITLKLDLDTMHTWELDHTELAHNYDISYSYASVADKNDNVVTVILTNKGTEITGTAVAASIPVKVWEYCGNGSNTNITAAEAWTIGYITAVSVNVEVEAGEVKYNDNTSATFSAEKIHIDTEAYVHYYKMDKTYFVNNTYHVHTEEAVEDLAKTCTTNGYTGRTQCSTCNAVLTWGTTEKAEGHKYVMTEGKLICECGKQYVATGLVEMNGNHYYLIGGEAQNGWCQYDKEWYYFDTTTYTSVETLNNGAVTYTFEENGKLTTGVWYRNSWGKRYYYGPTYYLGTMFGTWKTIDGVQYCFDNSGYVVTGLEALRSSHNTPFKVYEFNAEGEFVAEVDNYTGFVVSFDGTRYFTDGEMTKGLAAIDGKYYYFSSHTGVMRTGEYTVTVANSNGLLTENTTFTFDSKTGAAEIPNEAGFKVIDGNTYYYLDKNTYAKGLYEIEGNYYYFSTHTGIMRTGEYTVTAANSNGLLTKNTKFYFDEITGAATIPSTAGFKVIDGNTYYYLDENTYAKGLYEIEGKYYYFSTHTGIMRTGEYTVTVANSNGLLTETTKFYFDETTGAGEKPSNAGFKVVNGNTYYYFEDGTMAKGLYRIDEKLYYFSTTTGIMRTGEYTVNYLNSNGLLTKSTKFDFDETTGAAKDKIEAGFKVVDGKTYYYYADGLMALGLCEIDGKYYYFSTHTGVMRTGAYTINPVNSNGLLTTSLKVTLDATYGYAVDTNGNPITSLN